MSNSIGATPPTTPEVYRDPVGLTGPWQMLSQQFPTNPSQEPWQTRQSIGHAGNMLRSYVKAHPNAYGGVPTPAVLQQNFLADSILPNAPHLLLPAHTGLPPSGLPGLTREHEFLVGVLRQHAAEGPLKASELQQHLWSHAPLGGGSAQVGRNPNAVKRMLEFLNRRYPQTITIQQSPGGPLYGYAA